MENINKNDNYFNSNTTTDFNLSQNAVILNNDNYISVDDLIYKSKISFRKKITDVIKQN